MAGQSRPGEGLPGLKGGDCLGKPPEATGGFWRTSNIWFLNDFSICPKTNKNQQQSKSEAKEIPREAKVQKWFGESGPGEGLLNLKGVVVLSMFQLGRFGFSLRSKAEEVGKNIFNNRQNVSQIH